ncbi:hypothetical protein ACJRO7_000034 [Eucalyptus globulus]|uniref:Pyruvate carboxyltransferase domain-containing protein n=1 Tax=Eucalyptus globulus TaxID=34317 RepID=A0ABD3LMG1_EUCGL
MTSEEKLDIARQLAKLRVDIIQAGFPAASQDDFDAVKAIALEVGNAVEPHSYVPVICGLSRGNEKDIQAAWDAIWFADPHEDGGLRPELGCDDVKFSPEDASRFFTKFLSVHGLVPGSSRV